MKLPGSYWRHVCVGDVAVVLLGVCAVMASFKLLWQGGQAELAVIRSAGQIVAEYPLTQSRHYRVQGPLGTTEIEIGNGRARILSDPSPRQYCVQQGWLTRPGAIALCAPNQVSLSLKGRGGPSYDSLNY